MPGCVFVVSALIGLFLTWGRYTNYPAVRQVQKTKHFQNWHQINYNTPYGAYRRTPSFIHISARCPWHRARRLVGKADPLFRSAITVNYFRLVIKSLRFSPANAGFRHLHYNTRRCLSQCVRNYSLDRGNSKPMFWAWE